MMTPTSPSGGDLPTAWTVSSRKARSDSRSANAHASPKLQAGRPASVLLLLRLAKQPHGTSTLMIIATAAKTRGI